MQPGATFLVGVYHRWSVFAGLWFFKWVASGRTESWPDFLARIEGTGVVLLNCPEYVLSWIKAELIP